METLLSTSPLIDAAAGLAEMDRLTALKEAAMADLRAFHAETNALINRTLDRHPDIAAKVGPWRGGR